MSFFLIRLYPARRVYGCGIVVQGPLLKASGALRLLHLVASSAPTTTSVFLASRPASDKIKRESVFFSCGAILANALLILKGAPHIFNRGDRHLGDVGRDDHVVVDSRLPPAHRITSFSRSQQQKDPTSSPGGLGLASALPLIGPSVVSRDRVTVFLACTGKGSTASPSSATP